MYVHEVPGGLGKFEYEILPDTLRIVLPVRFDFVPGDKNRSPGFGASEYKWQGEEDKDHFKQELRNQTKEVWEAVFDFRGISKSGADPDLELGLVIDFEETGDPIWHVFAVKDPGDETTPAASVCEPGTRHFGAGCVYNPNVDDWGSLSMSSALINPVEMRIADGDYYTVWFNSGASDFSFEQNLYGELYDVIRRLSSISGWSAQLSGSASPTETAPTPLNDPNPHPAIELARERVAKLSQFLQWHGVDARVLSKTVRNPFLGYPEGDPAYVGVLVSSNRQSTFAHEVGHFFGLEDEYATDNHPEGERIKSDTYVQLIKNWGFSVPYYGNSRSIMSRGNTPYPRHYTPFLDLLSKAQPAYDWNLKLG